MKRLDLIFCCINMERAVYYKAVIIDSIGNTIVNVLMIKTQFAEYFKGEKVTTCPYCGVEIKNHYKLRGGKSES